jgi:hypothetical protein
MKEANSALIHSFGRSWHCHRRLRRSWHLTHRAALTWPKSRQMCSSVGCSAGSRMALSWIHLPHFKTKSYRSDEYAPRPLDAIRSIAIASATRQHDRTCQPKAS